MQQQPQPHTRFEWPLYADATLAGLSALFPIPLLDWALETYFRRRLPGSIARHRRQTLSAEVIQALNGPSRGCLVSGLIFLVQLPIELLKRLFRKLFYVLAIKEATDKLNDYWQRAFLIDYMLAAGHLSTVASAQRAYQAMERTLRSTPSPLIALAKTVVSSPFRVIRTLGRALNRKSPVSAPPHQSVLRRQWSAYQDYLQSLAVRYEHEYQTQGLQEGR